MFSCSYFFKQKCEENNLTTGGTQMQCKYLKGNMVACEYSRSLQYRAARSLKAQPQGMEPKSHCQSTGRP